ncbi:hypothetical protein DSAG12_02729 [Promethearchaeum syntrophicum]|uniref:Uncharacterized protein n=1 Tax=Promethearchaeum syntrophicum TaxID=2594042 RepID=A0A5B9DC75_9ARCH|nr:hypothetical protein [Candidatus Prometheoarchaeum syntrophicum]QEE16899.1 hypothetical protein DSAG12_02729 [Candidatus Prometheoarchaeum syntrophicum]
MQKSYYRNLNQGKKVINAEHKFTILQYQQKRAELNGMISEISDLNIDQLKSEVRKTIFRVNIENIKKSINYHFTSKAQRTLPILMKNFKKALKFVHHEIKFKPYFQTNTEIQKKFINYISIILQESLNQDLYLQDIEIEHHKLNI